MLEQLKLPNLKRGIALLGLIALGACQAADGTSQAPDTALVNSVMSGLGAVDPKAKPIEYKPRAPLAMPSNPTALPSPETQVAGRSSENWPENEVNQDLEDIRALYAQGGRDRNAPLTPEQMRGIDIRGAPTVQATAADARANRLITGERMTNEELREQGNAANALQQENLVATQNQLPQRRYLTDPPTEYSVPSPNAPMPQVVEVKTERPRDEYDSAPLDMRCVERGGGHCQRGANK
ncbi:hypothetical protein JM93_02147 [Roseibium hamelinense]|uniref:Beta-barrel assembly complex subunit BamF n=1 Tax=Roseibium hamelinense TaxID=150831 RepID=A0A562T3R5_9HYPH|nr:hypothetical protein [Roseibium hamelinense]MTI43380.1 hypothetical protein [Roseibium hamelinense]TWI87580.1 hypothetical protein JM93_02147 [Roseibium hamelinense]